LSPNLRDDAESKKDLSETRRRCNNFPCVEADAAERGGLVGNGAEVFR